MLFVSRAVCDPVAYQVFEASQRGSAKLTQPAGQSLPERPDGSYVFPLTKPSNGLLAMSTKLRG